MTLIEKVTMMEETMTMMEGNTKMMEENMTMAEKKMTLMEARLAIFKQNSEIMYINLLSDWKTWGFVLPCAWSTSTTEKIHIKLYTYAI